MQESQEIHVGLHAIVQFNSIRFQSFYYTFSLENLETGGEQHKNKGAMAPPPLP